ncbi:hydroxylamine reductase [Clostridium cochlearium]|uniref:hydroxylamine reductase n=1 Tax=Clostridium cochlearium TaxID=1494 RepID=UPI000BBC5C65|nr:hydroxylamine reductase [Clostridium cochlearium]MDU1443469.1 hydroxylamine reductase [Clostridium cochlearium]NME96519.1 hydroxylamine reductase [Clostridium cochlearium]
MENSMFCYQCEQTIGGKGCTKAGNCGKSSEVAALQDLLIYELKGIGFYGEKLLEKGIKIDDETDKFVMDATFATLTNVNFDPDRFVDYLKKAQEIKDCFKKQLGDCKCEVPEIVKYKLPSTKDEMLKDAEKAGIMYDETLDADIRSLREMLIYGMKGMGAYAHHAHVLGYKDEVVSKFFYKGFAAVVDDNLAVEDLFNLNMEFGQVNLKCMELLDKANTESYGNPVPTEVCITNKKGPFIIVSGHDLKDLKELLEQTEGKGINIYTHGEMLPAHGYPELKKYSHLVGNFGGAWQDQQKEFDGIPGCILMTTNCLQKPRESYKDRIFTTSIVGWPDISHIREVNGKKDFSLIINKALQLGGFKEDEPEKKITVGFGHNAVLSNADKIIEAVKNGDIKHFFLIGGCDGARPGRNYYTEIAERTPKDTIILTLACGKYRFNKLELGNIGDFPRVLDVGQCNDSYSAIKIALALADAFKCEVNDLPLSMILSWYEQKAVCILITLLSLGIKDIRLGPTLPAFITPNILQVLIDKFGIKPISTPDEDLKIILGE